jgi:hypothetical protein
LFFKKAKSCCNEDQNINTPTEIINLEGIHKIAHTGLATSFLHKNGSIFACGQTSLAGWGDWAPTTAIPLLHPIYRDIKYITHYHDHANFLFNNGDMVVFGQNGKGQLCILNLILGMGYTNYSWENPVINKNIKNITKINSIFSATIFFTDYLTSCFGINNFDNNVCSGNGECINDDICKCKYGYGGLDCNKFFCGEYLNNDINVCNKNGEI